MKKFIIKLFSWIKDRFSLLFTVVFRLHIGGKKKENPELSDIEESDDTKED